MHLRYTNTGVLQPSVVPQFCLDLVSEAVIIAWLVVNLLDNNMLSVLFSKIRIPSFTFAQQSENPVWCSVDLKRLHCTYNPLIKKPHLLVRVEPVLSIFHHSQFRVMFLSKCRNALI